MKTTSLAFLILLIGLVSLQSQTPAFNCGSNGSYGPMNITANTTLQLPPDGIFHCTTISISGGAEVKFTKNTLNTPVYLLATGDINIASGSTINISGYHAFGGLGGGVSGPGGYDGGPGSNNLSVPAGAGLGPGGGRRQRRWRCVLPARRTFEPRTATSRGDLWQ